MYNRKVNGRSGYRINNSNKVEPFETMIRRILKNNEPISDQVDVIYTERKDGVIPDYNIRADKFDIALDVACVVRAH